MTNRDAVFISHANPEDNVFTTWLGAKLSAHGYEVWADVLKVIGGQDWQRNLEDALRNHAAKVLLVGTQHGVSKQGVRNEIQIASDIAKKISDNEFIVPLRLEQFEAPFLIVHAQRIDFSQSWATGLKELLEALESYNVPKKSSSSPELWRTVQLMHGKTPVQAEERLISNWIKFSSLPSELRFYDFKAGISIGRAESQLAKLSIPVAFHNRGFVSFADILSLKEALGPELPFELKDSISTELLLEKGWDSLNIESKDARNAVSKMLRQGMEAVIAARGLSSYEMSSAKLCWFGAKGKVDEGQIRFNWPENISGRRQIIGHSEKRKLYWHYAVLPQVTMWPEPHFKLRGTLVFSEDGITPIDNSKKMHRLRRSFAKSWRNARWRDMVLSWLWWLSEGSDSLVIPFGGESGATLSLPTITFVSPISMPVAVEEPDVADEDDPDDTEAIGAMEDADDMSGMGEEE